MRCVSPYKARLSAALAALAACALCTTGALAQTVPPAGGGTLSLSDSEKSDLLAQNTESSVEAARAGLGNGGGGRAIHGEIGAMIGTHDTRGIYGTAAIPLGDNAGAVVSFESSHYGGYSRPH